MPARVRIFSYVREKERADRVRDGLTVIKMADNEELTETTYHMVEHGVNTIVCECVSLL